MTDTTDPYPLYPATAHALGCGMNNGRPVVACVCGLPNKALGELAPMTDTKHAEVEKP